ncbi:uncharacterized protein [Diadema antillarum]|uniref:uncharacterized protein n=1 Tax=Diadema antillarum TaxID=105358 RepID=UPI003A844579
MDSRFLVACLTIAALIACTESRNPRCRTATGIDRQSIGCPPLGPQYNREKPERPERPERPEKPEPTEKPERPELPESEIEHEEPDVEEPDFRDLGRPDASPCPPGDKKCRGSNSNGSVGMLGVYKAAAFIGMAILIAITVTVISLVIYCVWRRRRDRERSQHSFTLPHAHNGYATPGEKCAAGGNGAVCTCANPIQPCCQPANGKKGQHGDTNISQHHHYAGPTHHVPAQTTQTGRTPHAIPYAKSEAFPIRTADNTADNGASRRNDGGNVGGYMGLIKGRPEGDVHHPYPPSQPRQGLTQAVNHEYHLPHHHGSMVGTMRVVDTPHQLQRAPTGCGSSAQHPPEDPYYFKLNEGQQMAPPQPRPLQDRNIPDVIANRPVMSTDTAVDGRYEHISDHSLQKNQAQKYDTIFVQDGQNHRSRIGSVDRNLDGDESYDKLDRSKQFHMHFS